MKGANMSLDNVDGVTTKTTYVKGKPKLTETKTSESTTGSILVSSETTKQVGVLASTQHELTVFPQKEKAVKDDGSIEMSKDLTDEQLENLNKLKDAQEFMQTEEGAKLADSLLKQQIDISKGQKKWLKSKGIDPDAFVQEWNRLNPDSPNNKKFDKAQSENAKDEMAAYAKSFLGDQKKKANTPNEQEELKGLRKLFKKREKESVKSDNTYSNTGMKIMHHSSADINRDSKYSDDVTDEIAREGQKFLDAFATNDEGKRRAKFKEIDENGNDVTYKVRYNKDGSVKRVTVKSDETGKLKVKRERDGDITVKGDLQAKYAYNETPEVTDIYTNKTDKFKEVKTVTTDNYYLQENLKKVDTERLRVIKEDCPDPDVSYLDLRGKYVSDLPNQTKDFKQGAAVSAQTVIEQAEQMGMENLVKGYCGNSYSDKYKASSEPGNLNQLNARFITGCFINANQTIEKGPNGRDINGFSADYEKLNEFITEAFHRDQQIISVAGPKADNLILKYIAFEINKHNEAVSERAGANLPNTNNSPIDKEKLPEFFRRYIK